MKKITLSLFALIASINAFGWEINTNLDLGLRVGMNITNIDIVGGKGDFVGKGDSQIGFNIGTFYDWQIVENFHIQPGLSYTTRGTDLSNSDLSNKISLGYIQIPVLASYRFKIENKHKFAVNYGPTLGYAVKGQNKYQSYNTNHVKVDHSTSIFKNDPDYNRFELGFNMGISYFIKNHFINLAWERGLTNLYKDDTYEYKMKNNNISISAGYNF